MFAMVTQEIWHSGGNLCVGGQQQGQWCGFCQRIELTQVLSQIDMFNKSRVRARGRVSTDGTWTGTVHDFCEFLISLPSTLWCSILCVLRPRSLAQEQTIVRVSSVTFPFSFSCSCSCHFSFLFFFLSFFLSLFSFLFLFFRCRNSSKKEAVNFVCPNRPIEGRGVKPRFRHKSFLYLFSFSL